MSEQSDFFLQSRKSIKLKDSFHIVTMKQKSRKFVKVARKTEICKYLIFNRLTQSIDQPGTVNNKIYIKTVLYIYVEKIFALPKTEALIFLHFIIFSSIQNYLLNLLYQNFSLSESSDNFSRSSVKYLITFSFRTMYLFLF